MCYKPWSLKPWEVIRFYCKNNGSLLNSFKQGSLKPRDEKRALQRGTWTLKENRGDTQATQTDTQCQREVRISEVETSKCELRGNREDSQIDASVSHLDLLSYDHNIRDQIM